MIPAFIAAHALKKDKSDNRTHVHVGGDVDYVDDIDDFEDDEEVVLESKGGTPAPPSPMSEAQAQISLERERARIAAEQEAANRQRQEQERLQRIQQAAGKQSAVYDQALGFGRSQVGARGFDQGLVDQYGLLDLYRQGVDSQKLSWGEDNLNPTISTNTLFSDALDTSQGTYRGDLRKQLNTIADDDFAYDLFADTADDSILQEILTGRKADAQSQLDMARSRGQLNDTGYNRALGFLGEQSESAFADLQDLGLGVLSGYRDDLSGMRNTELDRIGAATFADPYNISGFENRLNTRVGDLQSRMRGDIFRSVGDQSFFDPSSIIGKSGALQGFYNPTTAAKAGTGNQAGTANPLLNAFTEEENKNTRSAPTGGVF